MDSSCNVVESNGENSIQIKQEERELSVCKTAELVKQELSSANGDGVEKEMQVNANKIFHGASVEKLPKCDEETELKIKPEFIVLNKVRMVITDLLSEKDKKVLEMESEEGSLETKADKGPKLKGQNKKRPPPMKFNMGSRICPSLVDVAENEEAKVCQYGEKCNYRHDLKAYMEERKPDILQGGCYNYRTNGRCARGISCLYGAEHLTSEGRNKINTNPSNPGLSSYHNFLSKDIQFELRKKKFNFSRADKAVEGTKPNKQQQSQTACVTALPTVSSSDEPASKKVCLETSGPLTDEDVITQKSGEKKKIDWNGKLYLAPLTTVGNLPFRRLCKTLGADITCGEMAMADAITNAAAAEWALVRKHSSEDIFGVQICGNNPYVLSKCGQLLEDTTEIDFIDLNLGCPIDLVYEKGAGSGLMKRKGPLESSIRAMSSMLRIPFTVKMRMGVYTNHPCAHELVEKCRDWGVSMVTVHGRSREQRYTRLSDWDYIGKCVNAASPMPIFGNGDILSFEDYEKDLETSGVSGVMIARGALIKPWIFTEIKERRHWDISSSERFQLYKNFANYGLEHWGSDSQGVERTRRFLLEWQSFSHRYVPVGLLERPPQKINLRPPTFYGRNDLETLMGSPNAMDWIRICEMLLGPAPDGFQFLPKHKANSWK